MAALVGTLVIACGGSTGREDSTAATAPDASSPDDPFRLDAGSFDVTIGYFDQILPDVMRPPDTGADVAVVLTGCAPSVPFDDAGNRLVIPPDASAASPVPNLDHWAAAEYDGGVFALSASGSLCAAELATVEQYNQNSPIWPTEQQFLNKDIANGDIGADGGPGFSCTNCLMSADCLNSDVDMVTGKECDDLSGIALRGQHAGTPRSELCLALLRCIFGTTPTCATLGVAQACYCGVVGLAACPSVAQGTGGCAQAEADGLELPISDPQDITKGYTNLFVGAGRANYIFGCAKTNGCATCWQ